MKVKATFAAGLAAVLLAMTPAAAPPTTSAPPGGPETLDAIFARKIARTVASPFYKWLHTPHNQRFLPQPWKPTAGEFLIDGGWSLRTAGNLEDAGSIRPGRAPVIFPGRRRLRPRRSAVGPGDPSKNGGPGPRPNRSGQLFPESRRRPDRDQQSQLARRPLRGLLSRTASPRTRDAGPEAPGRDAPPGLRRPDVRRRVRDVHGQRPAHRPPRQPRHLLGAQPVRSQRDVHFRQPHRLPRRLASIPSSGTRTARRTWPSWRAWPGSAAPSGSTSISTPTTPSCPSDHPVFQAHPNARGASQHGHDIRSLCASDPETLKFIADSWADVFRRVPELGGMVTIIGGEGFYHCYMRAGKDGPDCPRCREREPEDVVAGLTNAVFRAVRKVKPEAELLAWPYSAFIWSKDPSSSA